MYRQIVNNSAVKIIILVGTRDFGRDAIASRVSAVAWPVVGKTAVERLVSNLVEQGIRDIIICSHGDSSLLAKTIEVNNLPDLELHFLDESLPVGTAGAIRDSAREIKHKLLLVLPAAMISPPNIKSLIEAE